MNMYREVDAVGSSMNENMNGASGELSDVDGVSQNDTLLRTMERMLREAHAKNRLLEDICVEKQREIEYQHRLLTSTPGVGSREPQITPIGMTRQRQTVAERLSGRFRGVQREENEINGQNVNQPLGWEGENVSPIEQPSSSEQAGRRTPPATKKSTGARPKTSFHTPTTLQLKHRPVTQTTPPSFIPDYAIPQASPLSVLTTVPPVRPKDIRELKLSELSSVDTPARLNLFFTEVEDCVIEDKERIRVAMIRMDSELRVLVNNVKVEGAVDTWMKFKKYMSETFSVKLSFDQVFDATNELKYDWSQCPNDFKNTFICKYSNMKSQLKDEELPPMEKMLKNKLMEGFPAENREKLKGFIDRCVSMSSFMKQVQRQREVLHQVANSSVITLNTNSPSTPPYHNSPNTTNNNNRNNTNTNMKNNRSGQSGQGQKSCVYCRGKTHFVRDCFYKPSYFLCYDCKSTSCHRGHPNCPGWVAHQKVFAPNGQRIVPQPQSQNTTPQQSNLTPSAPPTNNTQ